jgi:hypothetical protein
MIQIVIAKQGGKVRESLKCWKQETCVPVVM